MQSETGPPSREKPNGKVSTKLRAIHFNPVFGPNLSRICNAGVTPSGFGALSSKALPDSSEIEIWSGPGI